MDTLFDIVIEVKPKGIIDARNLEFRTFAVLNHSMGTIRAGCNPNFPSDIRAAKFHVATYCNILDNAHERWDMLRMDWYDAFPVHLKSPRFPSKA
jgi:hypothetical protein